MLRVSRRIQSTSFLKLGYYYIMKWETVRRALVGVLSMFDSEGRIFRGVVRHGVDDILNVPHLFNYNLNQQE
jgi:hypothetical protein